MAELRLQWLRALDAAASAVQAAVRARTLPHAACAAEMDVLRRERAWLETVIWRDLA